MLQSIRIVSIPEQRIIKTVRSLEYGEMYGVEVPSDVGKVEIDLNEAEWKFINYLRAGNVYIDVLHIHMGMPALAENDFMMNGFRCRKKTKFPT